MRERRGTQEAIVFSEREDLRQALELESQMRVGADHALRRPGRAGGVLLEERRRVRVRWRAGFHTAGLDETALGAVEHEERRRVGERRQRLPGHVDRLGCCEERHRAGVREIVAELLVAVADVQRGDHAAVAHDPEEPGDEGGGVRRHQTDAGAGRDREAARDRV